MKVIVTMAVLMTRIVIIHNIADRPILVSERTNVQLPTIRIVSVGNTDLDVKERLNSTGQLPQNISNTI